MKYAQKLVCIILLVLGVSFSLGGSALLWADFADRLAQAEAQNAAAHALACQAMENDLLARQSRGDALTDTALTNCAANLPGDLRLCLLRGQTPVADRLGEADAADAIAALADGQRLTLRCQTGAGPAVFSFYRSTVLGELDLVTAYDLTALYADRTRSLQRFLVLEAAVLVGAAAVAVWASRRVTRPLAALTEASGRIAAGAYDQRTGLRSDDELGLLSASFDAMADAVQQRVAALELGVRQRQDFMAAFSHELKTPMTSIIGYADMLHAMKVDPAEQREAADAIYHEGKRLETLARKLLALMELDEAGLTLAPMPMENALRILRRAVTGPLDCPRCDAVVLGDADLLADLLYNLVVNAHRAGGRVWVRCAPGPAGLTVSVLDDGRGIPAAELARVLEPFYMVDKSRARQGGGSGLGLALCQRIAQAHGAALELRSIEGKGTLARFTLPMPAAQPAERAAAEPVPATDRPQAARMARRAVRTQRRPRP